MPLLYFILEIGIFVLMVQWLGFWWSLLVYVLPSFLGFILLSFQSRELMTKMQGLARDGQSLPKDILHSAAPVIGAIFLIIPGFLTRTFGILLIFPPTRWLLISLSSFLFFKKLMNKSFSFYQFGNGAFHVHSQFGSFHEKRSNEARDVTQTGEVIDVVPLKIENKTVKPEQD